MKGLADSVHDYIALRRERGFKLRHETWVLPAFAAFMEAQGGRVITAELALRFAQQPPDAHPNWWAQKLGMVRRFARYRRAFDPQTELLPADLLPYRATRATPHIYDDQEIAALLRQTRSLPSPLRAATYSTLIGLLAVTGMRVGEAIGLDRQDFDPRRQLLTIRSGKFGKSRRIPLHPSTVDALATYEASRDRLRPHRRCSSFFVSLAGTRLIYANVQQTFLRLVKEAGLIHLPGRPPCLHALRHTFAVTTLLDWYRAGVEVEPRLYSLSTYLGHVNPSTTYWYLTATPDLLQAAAERLDLSLGGKP